MNADTEIDPLALAEEPIEETTQEVDLDESEREHYERIKELNHQVLQAQKEYDFRKSLAASAKKDLELAQLDLTSAIEAGPQKADPQKELAFADDPSEWQEVPIGDVLTLTVKQCDLLSSAGAITVGKFEHLRSGQHPDYPDGLRSLRGVGDATVDKWEDQIVNWLSANAREASEPE